MTETKKYHINDYVRTHYLVPETILCINILDDQTQINTRMKITSVNLDSLTDLILNGSKDINLKKLTINKSNVSYKILQNDDRDIVIEKDVISEFLKTSSFLMLELESTICPETNTELSGMYKSNGVYCTQCEPYGYRKISYSLDRPDVLSTYTVTITASKKKCPVMLSNGNVVLYEPVIDSDSDLHRITWHDPHPKASYLFAVVAGDLGYIENSFTTKGNKHVTLRIYSPHDKVDQLDFAMNSIIMSMKWDEERFGLSYDLDIFNVVCLDDFNMGAMENKGLNIFNSKYVLANPMTATDIEHELITDVIGHEYFHNWTGNRVTLEKWFDLTLKEGLTVYRDQEFTLDTSVSRIQNLIQMTTDIRNGQFMEDQGPNAHPIRPQSYVVMDNFYTSTVYDKGAEIVRIYETLLGRQGFRNGMDLYFKRHDGNAVACENFWSAMLDANVEATPLIKVPMQRLFNWYNQPGTPSLCIDYTYNQEKKEFIIRTKQSNQVCTEMNKIYHPVLLPIKMGLLNVNGTMIRPTNVNIINDECSFVLPCCELEQEFVLCGIDSNPVPSFMRDFSAPCIINYQMSTDDRLFLMRTDPNQWNRWEQSQILAKHVIGYMYEKISKKTLIELADAMVAENSVKKSKLTHENHNDVLVNKYIDNMITVLCDPDFDPILKSHMLMMPQQDELMMYIPQCDPVLLFEHVIQRINGMIIEKSLEYVETSSINLMKFLVSVPYKIEYQQVSARHLLKTLMTLRLSHYDATTMDYVNHMTTFFNNSNNLTSKVACIRSLGYACSQNLDPDHKINQVLFHMLDQMADNYQGDSLMTAKWLAHYSAICSPDTVKTLAKLYSGQHPRSSMVSKITPNHLYSLILRFSSNPYFHQLEIDNNDQYVAPGYKFLTECIMDIDTKNTVVASRIASVFEIVDKLPKKHKDCMKLCIMQILNKPELSASTKEIVFSFK